MSHGFSQIHCGLRHWQICTIKIMLNKLPAVLVCNVHIDLQTTIIGLFLTLKNLQNNVIQINRSIFFFDLSGDL